MILNIYFDIDEKQLNKIIESKNMAQVDWKALRKELIEGYQEKLEDDISSILDIWREEAEQP